MSEFIDRPTLHRRLSDKMTRLIETADNGKAIPWPKSNLGGYVKTLARRGLQGHCARLPDGTSAAWCERIEPNGHAG